MSRASLLKALSDGCTLGGPSDSALFVFESLNDENVVLCSGIGQVGLLLHLLPTYGRATPC